MSSPSKQQRLVRLEERIRRLEEEAGFAEEFPSLPDLERKPEGPTLRLSQVKAVIGLSMPKCRELVEAGDIRGVRHGRHWFVAWLSLRTYLFSTGMLPLTTKERAHAGR